MILIRIFLYLFSSSTENDDFQVKPTFSRKLPTLLRPQTGVGLENSGFQALPRSPRAQTAPSTYKYPPNLDYTHPVRFLAF